MIFITSFTLYVSAIYNNATATSNTDLIINSVIILFVITVDECIYAILKTMSRRGVENMSSQVPKEGQETHLISAAEKRSSADAEEGDRTKQAKMRVVVAQERAAGNGVKRVDHLPKPAAL